MSNSGICTPTYVVASTLIRARKRLKSFFARLSAAKVTPKRRPSSKWKSKYTHHGKERQPSTFKRAPIHTSGRNSNCHKPSRPHCKLRTGKGLRQFVHAEINSPPLPNIANHHGNAASHSAAHAKPCTHSNAQRIHTDGCGCNTSNTASDRFILSMT